MQTVYKILEGALTTTELGYLLMKLFVASYFFIDIINFWTLTLIYNVLNISTMPAFSKYYL